MVEDFLILLLSSIIITIVIRFSRPNIRRYGRIIEVEKTVWHYRSNVIVLKRDSAKVLSLAEARRKRESNRATKKN